MNSPTTNVKKGLHSGIIALGRMGDFKGRAMNLASLFAANTRAPRLVEGFLPSGGSCLRFGAEPPVALSLVYHCS